MGANDASGSRTLGERDENVPPPRTRRVAREEHASASKSKAAKVANATMQAQLAQAAQAEGLATAAAVAGLAIAGAEAAEQAEGPALGAESPKSPKSPKSPERQQGMDLLAEENLVCMKELESPDTAGFVDQKPTCRVMLQHAAATAFEILVINPSTADERLERLVPMANYCNHSKAGGAVGAPSARTYMKELGDTPDSAAQALRSLASECKTWCLNSSTFRNHAFVTTDEEWMVVAVLVAGPGLDIGASAEEFITMIDHLLARRRAEARVAKEEKKRKLDAMKDEEAAAFAAKSQAPPAPYIAALLNASAHPPPHPRAAKQIDYHSGTIGSSSMGPPTSRPGSDGGQQPPQKQAKAGDQVLQAPNPKASTSAAAAPPPPPQAQAAPPLPPPSLAPPPPPAAANPPTAEDEGVYEHVRGSVGETVSLAADSRSRTHPASRRQWKGANNVGIICEQSKNAAAESAKVAESVKAISAAYVNDANHHLIDGNEHVRVLRATFLDPENTLRSGIERAEELATCLTTTRLITNALKSVASAVGGLPRIENKLIEIHLEEVLGELDAGVRAGTFTSTDGLPLLSAVPFIKAAQLVSDTLTKLAKATTRERVNISFTVGEEARVRVGASTAATHQPPAYQPPPYLQQHGGHAGPSTAGGAPQYQQQLLRVERELHIPKDMRDLFPLQPGEVREKCRRGTNGAPGSRICDMLMDADPRNARNGRVFCTKPSCNFSHDASLVARYRAEVGAQGGKMLSTTRVDGSGDGTATEGQPAPQRAASAPSEQAPAAWGPSASGQPAGGEVKVVDEDANDLASAAWASEHKEGPTWVDLQQDPLAGTAQAVSGAPPTPGFYTLPLQASPAEVRKHLDILGDAWETLSTLDRTDDPVDHLLGPQWLAEVTKDLPDPDHFTAGSLSKYAEVWEAFFSLVYAGRPRSAQARWLSRALAEGLAVKWVDPFHPGQSRTPNFCKKLEIVRAMLAKAHRPPGKTVEDALVGNRPSQATFPNHRSLELHIEFARTEVQKLLQRCSIKQWGAPEPPVVVNGLLVVEQPGKLRLCMNPMYVNLFSEYRPFKYERLQDMIDYLRPGDLLYTTDDKSGYHHVALHPSVWKYLAFQLDGVVYCFTHLPFGLAPACRYYTELKSEIFRHLRERFSIRMTFLIDDQCGAAEGIPRATRQSRGVTRLLGSLGFFMGWRESKCQLRPEPRARFLGMIVDALRQLFQVPTDKVEAFKLLAAETLAAQSLTARAVARVVGKIVAMSPAISLAPLYSQALYKALVGMTGWDDAFETPDNFKAELELFLRLLELKNGKTWWKRGVTLTIAGDSSEIAHAAFLPGRELGEEVMCVPFSREELEAMAAGKLSSTVRELTALWLSLHWTWERIPEAMRQGQVVYQTDNLGQSFLVMGQRGGPTTFPLVYQTVLYCAERDIELTVEWHPRDVAAQQEADDWSKVQDNSQWALNAEVYELVVSRWALGGRKPTVDCFADSFTTKVPGSFFSRYWCPGTKGIDGFKQSWAVEGPKGEKPLAYINPPFDEVGKVLRKLADSQVDAVLILPVWPRWWQALLNELPVRERWVLPHRADLCVPGPLVPGFKKQGGPKAPRYAVEAVVVLW